MRSYKGFQAFLIVVLFGGLIFHTACNKEEDKTTGESTDPMVWEISVLETYIWHETTSVTHDNKRIFETDSAKNKFMADKQDTTIVSETMTYILNWSERKVLDIGSACWLISEITKKAYPDGSDELLSQEDSIHCNLTMKQAYGLSGMYGNAYNISDTTIVYQCFECKVIEE